MNLVTIRASLGFVVSALVDSAALTEDLRDDDGGKELDEEGEDDDTRGSRCPESLRASAAG